ncbi:hypothetical protein SynRS9915_00535 [Synechococcus sp. RS9915]|nr:hypothetical protein SynRS9915_00535 [Synechococcus sp. RS9915]
MRLVEVTYSQARQSLKSLLDLAVQDREIVMVRRRQGGDVALVAADELESLLETAHLLRSPRNAERLLQALHRSQAGEDLASVHLDRLEADLDLSDG